MSRAQIATAPLAAAPVCGRRRTRLESFDPTRRPTDTARRAGSLLWPTKRSESTKEPQQVKRFAATGNALIARTTRLVLLVLGLVN